jgi:hypothetical protein
MPKSRCTDVPSVHGVSLLNLNLSAADNRNEVKAMSTLFERCRDILIRECEMVQKAASIQSKIGDAVTKREWIDFEGHFEAMNAMGSAFTALEKEREGLFAEFEAAAGRKENAPHLDDDKGRFYALAASLPAEQREELTALYRSLKLEALRLRMAGESLLAYLGSAKATLEGFIELAFPDRGGRMYSHRGTKVTHDMRSMVLNHSF